MDEASRRGRRSRNKGKRGEREAAALLSRYGFEARRAQQFKGSAGSADIDCPELRKLGIEVEVKNVKRPTLGPWIEQCQNAGYSSFMILWKRERDGWYAVLPADFLLALLARLRGIT